jgi:3-oxoacyl-[acyl-carrier-protein] synthase-1
MRIVVAGIGMATSLGLDAHTCCAAARALISRAVTVDWLNAGSGRPWGSEPLAAHAVRITNGFVGLGKAVALGSLALRDLISRTQFSIDDLASTGFFINVSDKHCEDECANGQTAIPPSGESPSLPSAAWRERTAELIPRLLNTCKWAISPANQRLFYGGHASFVQALEAAMGCISRGTLSQCVVGGIDSLVEPSALEAANIQGAAKAEGRAVGFMPGEAAAFLLLKTVDAVRWPDELAFAITGTAVMDAGRGGQSEPAAAGKALAQAIASVKPNGPTLLVGDLNGEESRAMEWGYTALYLTQKFRDAADQDLWTPAQHFGEVGAAAGPVAACLALRALQRGYPRTQNFVVWLSSGTGLKGAFRIDRRD